MSNENSNTAIINQSKGNRYSTQQKLIEQVKRYPGDTTTQASWRFIGGSIVDGQCVPANEFVKYMGFFNATRRLVEMTGKHNSPLKRDKARLNAHADASGLYLAGDDVDACLARAVDDQQVDDSVADPDVAERSIKNIMGMLDDE